MNLLQETIDVLKVHNHVPEDVLWVGSEDGEYAITWDEFAKIADDEYDEGYGGQEVAKDLVIVGAGWWYSRGECDGSEWWDYNCPINRREDYKSFNRCLGGIWSSIQDMIDAEKNKSAGSTMARIIE